jgi:hypothetical protein
MSNLSPQATNYGKKKKEWKEEEEKELKFSLTQFLLFKNESSSIPGKFKQSSLLRYSLYPLLSLGLGNLSGAFQAIEEGVYRAASSALWHPLSCTQLAIWWYPMLLASLRQAHSIVGCSHWLMEHTLLLLILGWGVSRAPAHLPNLFIRGQFGTLPIFCGTTGYSGLSWTFPAKVIRTPF